MNDPKTAAQHNAQQTGEAYSILNNAELEAIRARYQSGAVSRLLAERDALVKEIAELKNLDLGHRLEAFGLADENILPACNCLNEAPTFPTFRDNPHREKCRVRRIWEATVNVCAIGQKGLAAMDDKRKAAEKERDTLHEHLSVMKARNLMRGIRSACEKCGHENNEDGCAHCLREQPKIGVTALISDSNGRILLGLKGRAFNSGFVGKWVTPGGRVQKGETLVLAIVREVKEETGLLVKVVTALPQRELIHPNGHFVFSVFQAVVIGGKESAGDDLRDVRWFCKCDLELLKDDMTPLTRDIVFAKPPDTERLRGQVTKLREACLSLLGAAENETNALPSTIVMARKALAQTEAK